MLRLHFSVLIFFIKVFLSYTSESNKILPDEHTKIVGGYLIDVEDASFVALITYKNRPHCGGSIISTEHILSASHCVESSNKTSLYKVKTGTSNIFDGEIHYVVQIYQHPSYKSFNFDYDFAIFKIAYPMAFNNKQRPIALVDNESETPKTGEMVRVLGWGDTMNIFESTNDLRAVELSVIDHEKCEKQYLKYRMNIRLNKICAAHSGGIDGKDACQGDSGGPLQNLNNGKLCGVVSFGLGCAQIKYAGVYARVDSAREWIRSIANA